MLLPVWTWFHTCNWDIVTDSAFSRETLAVDGKHGSHSQQARIPYWSVPCRLHSTQFLGVHWKICWKYYKRNSHSVQHSKWRFKSNILINITRQHSSRMRTAHCSDSGGCLPGDGVSAQRGSGWGCPWGCLPRGCPAPVHASWDTHPTVDRMTDACENITLPHLCCGR